MNQILCTKLDNNSSNLKKKNWFKFQFVFSIFIVTILLGSVFSYLYNLKQKENFSNNLLSNYNIYKLYSSTHNSENQGTSNELFRHN